jgi:hypothetical protein
MSDENDVIDDDEHADLDQEDIGTDEPGNDVDDTIPDEEIDDLPEVGEPDLNEEPILDD